MRAFAETVRDIRKGGSSRFGDSVGHSIAETGVSTARGPLLQRTRDKKKGTEGSPKPSEPPARGGELQLLGNIDRLPEFLRPIARALVRAVENGELAIGRTQGFALVQLLGHLVEGFRRPPHDPDSAPDIPLSLVMGLVIGREVTPFLGGHDLFLPREFFARAGLVLALPSGMSGPDPGRRTPHDTSPRLAITGHRDFQFPDLDSFPATPLGSNLGPIDPRLLASIGRAAPRSPVRPSRQRLELMPPPERIGSQPSPTRIEALVGAVHHFGLPGHRNPTDVVLLATQIPGIAFIDLFQLLRLPATRTCRMLRHLAIGTPPHRSLAFMISLAVRFPGLSVGHLLRLGQLPTARDSELDRLVGGRPKSISMDNLVTLVTLLNHRHVPDLLDLASLFPQFTLPNIVALGGAPAHRSGEELVRLARKAPAQVPIGIVTIASLPPTRSLRSLLHLCSEIRPNRTVVDLVYLATQVPAADVLILAPLAELPNLAAIPVHCLSPTARAFDLHSALLLNPANSLAAITSPHLNNLSSRLDRLVQARDPQTFANLNIILQWAHYTDFPQMLSIVGHPKILQLAHLITWLTTPRVNSGTHLLQILQSPKIQNSTDINVLLAGAGGVTQYDLVQILRWLGHPWATRSAVNKVNIDGRVPLAHIPGTGTTAGQRYSPDQPSGAYHGAGILNRVCHLSMSFALEGPPHARVARYTGFHVSWRVNGAPDHPADPRQWFTVKAGRVALAHTSGAFPVGAPGPNMVAEATTLMRNYLTRVNCAM